MNAIDKSVLLRIFSAALLIFAVLGTAGCGKTYSHDEFSRLVMHKSAAEVKSALGEPAWISEGKPVTWVYHRKTFDAANQNKSDDKVSLIIAPDAATGEDKVVEVRFD